MQTLASLRHGLSATATRFAVIVLGILVGLGVPAGWIWIGSQIQDSTAPSWTALAVVHVGLIFTLLLIAGFFSFFVARSKAKKNERADWMRGMTEERQVESISDVHPLELIIFCAVFIDIIVFIVWFFAFANPGTPVGQG
jgi:heme/copper-type cytochrome/quinol oxidase subunit 2